jgi:ribonuclease G
LKKQVLVSIDRAETRVALLEATGTPAAAQSNGAARRRRRSARPGAGYRIAELYIERRNQRSIVGNIYKGRVEAVLPGLEAAFVDIGLEKNGFLHLDEIVLPGVDVGRRGRGSGRQITNLLKPDQEIIVQVVKDPLKTKGARLSMELTIAGRYMVYAPTGNGIGVSRRLEARERERLRRATAKLELGEGGVIVRTAAQGASRLDFERELLYLRKLHEVLEGRAQRAQAPALVFQEADLSVRVIRDIFSDEFERALVDQQSGYERLCSFLARTAPELVDRVELWSSEEDLFESYGVERVIDQTLSRRVDLPSGGYLMIDHAEALTVIDVNSGSFIGGGKDGGLEETITQTNLEAAGEVVNQLRLRDIGGIIVIDFIDMARARNREAVMKRLREALDEDRTKTFTAEISALGLVEMTRQNVTEGLREIMSRPCSTCGGEGVVRSEETIAIEHERKLRKVAAQNPTAEAFLVQMNPHVTMQFTGQGSRALAALEQETGKFFHFEGSEGLPLEHFAITFMGSREEVQERALPFREGDEVFVDIVEPHMYVAEDAVAKIDGYIVSIAGAASHVGEKHLVRIERADRTSASAVLIDEEGNVLSAPGPSAGNDRGVRLSGGEPKRERSRSRSGAIEDARTRAEAGLAAAPTSADSEPEEDALLSASAPARERHVRRSADGRFAEASPEERAGATEGEDRADRLPSSSGRRQRRPGRSAGRVGAPAQGD